MKQIAFIVAASALLALTGNVQAGERKCKCVANGTMYVEGQVVCLRIGSSSFTARCERFLNNTTWTRVQDGCDALSMTVPQDSGDSGAISIARYSGDRREIPD